MEVKKGHGSFLPLLSQTQELQGEQGAELGQMSLMPPPPKQLGVCSRPGLPDTLDHTCLGQVSGYILSWRALGGAGGTDPKIAVHSG